MAGERGHAYLKKNELHIETKQLISSKNVTVFAYIR